jgi:uncharacterized protein (TIGR00730 family)
MKSVCVYCGSSLGATNDYVETANALGQMLAARGMRLIYGGGAVGLMGATADAVLANGGKAIGIIPQLLMNREVGHTGLTELHVVPDMHTRKRMMAEMADAFLTLPGGLGTFEELFEIWTWRQLGYHDKPIGLLNLNGYYDPLIQFLASAEKQGFVRQSNLDYVRIDDDLDRLMDQLSADYEASSKAVAHLDAA